MADEKHAGGRPLKFSTAEELETRINAYFDDCDEEYDRRVFKHDEIVVEAGKPVCGNCWKAEKSKGCIWVSGERKVKRPYTVTGLALWLNTTRQTLLEYQGEVEGREKSDPKYADAITHAKQRIENFASERLFDPDAPTKGVIFSLSNNGDGWAEKREQKVTLPKDGAAALAADLLGGLKASVTGAA